MMRLPRCVALSGLLLAIAARAVAQSSSPPPAPKAGQAVQPAVPQPGSETLKRGTARGPDLWWRQRSPISKELGLTKEQADRIEKLFQDTRAELGRLDDSLRRRESMLSELIRDDSPDAMIAQQIDKVEATRSLLNKTRQMMLYRMRQVLTAPQRTKFEVLHAQFQEELHRADLEREKQELERRLNQDPQSRDKPSPGRRGGRLGL